MTEELYRGVYRICIPFDDVYTTSFLLPLDSRSCIIADAATTPEDVEMYILPAVAKFGWEVRYLVISHSHSDHVGGLPTLEKAFPSAVSLRLGNGSARDGMYIGTRWQLLSLPGHAPDCLGILDTEAQVLFTFDALQQRGVSHYRDGVRDATAYRATLVRIASLPLTRIIASHDYIPYGYTARGTAEIRRYLEECAAAVRHL